MPNKYLSTVATGLLLLAQAACTHSDIATTAFFREYRSIPVEITGDAPAVGAPVAVDIHNHAGSVIVEVDDRLTAPEVKANLIRPKDLGSHTIPREDAADTVTATYETATGPGVPGNAATLRIKCRLVGDYPTDSAIALRVRIPRCDGLSIVNNAGPIVIIGTDGAVTAQSGVTTGFGGRIEFRTSHPLRDPVALITTQGRISAVIDPEGAGRFELATEDGQASFGSAYGIQTDVSPGMRSYRGVWNGGQNPFVARSARGDVSVLVKPDAEMYSTADDWMALIYD